MPRSLVDFIGFAAAFFLNRPTMKKLHFAYEATEPETVHPLFSPEILSLTASHSMSESSLLSDAVSERFANVSHENG